MRYDTMYKLIYTMIEYIRIN